MSGAEPETDLRYVRVGPHTIRTSVCGVDGRPLVLVNGIGAGIETWKHLRAALGPQLTIVVDIPGTGGSSTMWWPVTMRELARIVLEAAAQVVPEDNLDVLGYSFGGAVAQEMARLAPERVSGLVLAATNVGWGSPPGNPLAMLSAARKVRA